MPGFNPSVCGTTRNISALSIEAVFVDEGAVDVTSSWWCFTLWFLLLTECPVVLFVRCEVWPDVSYCPKPCADISVFFIKHPFALTPQNRKLLLMTRVKPVLTLFMCHSGGSASGEVPLQKGLFILDLFSILPYIFLSFWFVFIIFRLHRSRLFISRYLVLIRESFVDEYFSSSSS